MSSALSQGSSTKAAAFCTNASASEIDAAACLAQIIFKAVCMESRLYREFLCVPLIHPDASDP